MEHTQIRIWNTDYKIIFEYNGTIKETIEEAVRRGISLAFADLYHTDLSGADLNHAILRGADLKGAILRDANLYDANLKDTNLNGAKLNNAGLINANLSGADLSGADLNGAYLHCADLTCANLSGADLSGADLSGTIGVPYYIIPLACPAEGSFVAWKKVDNKLVKLEIPEDAKRSSATTHKCRCSKAKVLAITNLKETESFDEVFNGNYAPLTYKVGEMVYPDWFNEDRWDECSHGIHFFMDKVDALNW